MYSPAPASSILDVNIPFRVLIPNGEATFTVRVCHDYLQHRQFYFSQMIMYPDYFSLQAEKLNLEAKQEKDTVIRSGLSLRATIANPKVVYGDDLKLAGTNKPMIELIRQFNSHFEAQKPSFCPVTPVFLDWTDLLTPAMKEDPNNTVPYMTDALYDEDYDEIKHAGFLPASARFHPEINHHLPPIGSMPADYDTRMRLRLWMAPKVRLAFSNLDLLTQMGFTAKHTTSKRKQEILENNTERYLVITADRAPLVNVPSVAFKVSVSVTEAVRRSKKLDFEMTKSNWLDHHMLAQELSNNLKALSLELNITFSMAYNDTEKKFWFAYPNSQDLDVAVECEPQLAHRMGYGMETEINKHMKPLAMGDKTNMEDALKLALALVYDTGLVVCTLDQASSNNASGSLDQYMAALFPRQSGVLAKAEAFFQSSEVPMALPQVMSGAGGKVPVQFRLLRSYNDQTMSDFAWSCDAYIEGVLCGTVAQRQKHL